MKRIGWLLGLLLIAVASASLLLEPPAMVNSLPLALGTILGISQAKAAAPEKLLPAASMFETMLERMRKKRREEPWDPRRFSRNPYLMLDLPVENWLATPEGKFAHAIKIPNPVSPDSGYRPGMTQQQYFELLCKNDAGEFIFKTADNVDTILQMRGRKLYLGSEWAHLYAIEDPYGHFFGEVETLAHDFVSPRMYQYFEIAAESRQFLDPVSWKSLSDASMFLEPPPEARIARYFGYDNWSRMPAQDRMKLEFDTKARARYGFTWRGIKRPFDREMGIAGGELIVLDFPACQYNVRHLPSSI